MIDYMSPNNNKAGKSGSNLKDSIFTSKKKNQKEGKKEEAINRKGVGRI
jgi:hypothetical protein